MATDGAAADDKAKQYRRWYRLTPGRLIVGLLAVEGLLWLSEQFRWFPFNQHKGWTVLVAVAGVGAAMLLMLLWFGASVLLSWRFQFTLRSLLVLTLAVAVPFSWLAWEVQRAERQGQTVKGITHTGGAVTYDDYPADSWHYGTMSLEPPAPAWLMRLLPYDFFTTPVYAKCRQATDADLEDIRKLTQLQTLDLRGTRVSDAGLKHLEELTQLQTLILGQTQISDAGLAHLGALTQLQELNLSYTLITDAGLADLKGLGELRTLHLRKTQVTGSGLTHLKGLMQLQTLNLGDTQVTDASLENLQGLTQLHWLALDGTRVTRVGVMKLQQALPNCWIMR